MKNIYILIAFLFSSLILEAQSNHQGEINGYVTDDSHQKMVGIKLTLIKDNQKIATAISDSIGYYNFTFLSPGIYQIYIYKVNQIPFRTGKITLLSEEPLKQDITYSQDYVLGETKVNGTKNKQTGPQPCLTCNGTVISTTQINLPPNAKGATDFSAGYNTVRGGLSVGGHRPDGNNTIRNGQRINPDGIIYSALEQIELNTGGISAKYGDMSGGQISYVTQSPSDSHRGNIQYISSSPFELRNFNQWEAFLKGPLIKSKKDSSLILGYVFAANYIYTKDANPSSTGYTTLKKSEFDDLNAHPFNNTKTGVELKANSYTSDQFQKNAWNPGNGKTTANIFTAFEWRPNKRITMNAEISFMDVQNRQISQYQSMYNSNVSPLNINRQLAGSLRMNHILINNKDAKLCKNAWYNIRFDFNNQWSENMDANFGKNLFEYGYLGKYTVKSKSTYTLNQINIINGKPKTFTGKTADGLRDTTLNLYTFFEQGADSSLGIEYIAGESNKIRANYTSDIIDIYGTSLRSLNDISSKNGLLNGDIPNSIYSLFAAPGTPISAYSKSNVNLMNIGAEAGVKLMGKGRRAGVHDIIFGIQYEQRTYRSYSINANNLWTLMRQLSKQSEPVLDLSHPIFVYASDGTFLDTVKYTSVVDPNTESNFIKNIRERLINSELTDANGKLYNKNSRIETDRIDPSFFRLSDFSADELLNGGKSSLVNYYGYDYLGNKVKGKSSIENFLNNDSRTVGGFNPIYTSFYIQDRYTLRDFSVQAGLRIENYDANQPILKDAYSLYPTKTVHDVKAENSGLTSQLNPSMSDDAVVYVNDIQNPTSITGYRVTKSNNQADWFDKNGNSLSNPEELAHLTTNGRIAPYLANPNQKNITSQSFKDYPSQWNFLPRIWFKFPISSDAFFFAHYDVYAQRPPEGVIATIDDYYFLPQRSTEIINNPALKPVKRTDYELGFKHRIGKNALLSLLANYSEVRNLIQVTRFNQAFPVSYTSFGNLDFSTIKSTRIEYQSSSEHLTIVGSYSLQFADGTGSNGLSSASLIGSGQPNLRNVYPLDYDIRHVIKANIDFHFNDLEGKIRNKYIFQNSGFNLTLQARSGTPYTKIIFPVNTVQEGIANRTMMDGSINGSRMTWNMNADINIFKNFKLYKKSGALIHNKKLTAFLWIQNIFNFKNTQQVYQYTGSPNDDGYLQSAWGQQALRNEKYARSFTDLYNAKLLNPFNMGIPRMIQMGIKYSY